MSRLKPIIFAIFILIVFLQFLKIELLDSDFWWHIATGRYIVTEGHLPEKDPFSFTSTMEENTNLFPERENFILKQYWLSQIIFYFIYDYAGPKGIIILRSALYTMTILLVFWRLLKWSVSFPISFISAFVLYMLCLSKLTGERPVLFTILFTALIFFILEDFKDKKDKRIFLLLPLMLLWSNLHGGFIIGVVIIMVFMLGEGLKILLKKTIYTKHEIILFYTATALALGFSFINPTGWDAFAIAFSSKYKPFIQNIQEYESPFIVYFIERLYPINYWYVILAVLFPLILFVRNRKMSLTHIILLSGLLIMSFSATRFIIYYGIIAVMVLGKEFDICVKELLKKRFSEQMYVRLFKGLTIAVLFSLILYAAGLPLFKSPSFTVARRFILPVAAADFIEANRPSGNVFNYLDHGGYITWRFYPWKKTFIDSRALNLTVISEFAWIVKAVNSLHGIEPSPVKGPLWKRLLEHYNVNFVFLPLHDIYGSVPAITFKLSESDKWVPIYCDDISIIFVRDIEQNRDLIEKFKLSKEHVYNTIIYQLTNFTLHNKVNPRPLLSLGETFHKMGRLNDALTAYRYAMNRLPSPLIQEKLNQIESEMKMKEKAD